MNVSMYLSVKWRVGIVKLDYIEHIVPFFFIADFEYVFDFCDCAFKLF